MHLTVFDVFPNVWLPDADVPEVPIVVSTPHAGTHVPDDAPSDVARRLAPLVRDGDLFVDLLCRGVSALGAVHVSTPYTRFWVDLNRYPDDLSPRAVAGVPLRLGEGFYGDRGAIWAVTARGRPIYDAPMSRGLAAQRIDAHHRPYHDALARELARLRAAHGIAVLLDLHSMPSRAVDPASGLQATRPDVIPGDAHGTTCDPWLRDATVRYWEARGRTTRLNEPYAGGAIVRTHGAPAGAIHAIQLEINRALYMDESAAAPSSGFDLVARQVQGWVDDIAQVVTTRR